MSSLAQLNNLFIDCSCDSFLSLRVWMSSSQVVIISYLRSSSLRRLLLASYISLPIRSRSMVRSRVSSRYLTRSQCLSFRLCSCGFLSVRVDWRSWACLILSSANRLILFSIQLASKTQSLYLLSLIQSAIPQKSGLSTAFLCKLSSILLALTSVSNFSSIFSFCNISCSQYFSSYYSSLCRSYSFSRICEISLFFMIIISCCLRSRGQKVFSFWEGGRRVISFSCISSWVCCRAQISAISLFFFSRFLARAALLALISLSQLILTCSLRLCYSSISASLRAIKSLSLSSQLILGWSYRLPMETWLVLLRKFELDWCRYRCQQEGGIMPCLEAQGDTPRCMGLNSA